MKRIGVWLTAGLLIQACGSSKVGDLFGPGGSGGASGSGATGGTSDGGFGGSGASGGTAGAGAMPSGATGGIGAAPGGGGAPDAAPGGGAPGGGGAPDGGGAAGAGGAPLGGGGTGGATSYCAGHCGDGPFGPNQCYCDALCLSEGDCCDGFVAECAKNTAVCGNDLCDVSANKFCCRDWNGSDWSASCVGAGTTCATDVHCDGPEDCGNGQVCCGQYDPNTNTFFRLECRAVANCVYGPGVRVICTTAPGSCPSGTTCLNTYSPPGYGYCGKP